jgi:hypothetical protein
MRRFAVALALLTMLALGGQHFGVDLTPRPAEAIEIETVVWQFGQDYPGAEGDDTLLPVGTVHVKTHDGTDWMSTYDGASKAVTGPAALRRLIADYNAKGIEVVAWFVPKGVDVEGQVAMAEAVLDTGVKALYADVEPFDGFCYWDCNYLAEQFWWRLRAERPEANLGVIYDPREWTWQDSGTWKWLSTANAALPMCYWEMYADQGIWADPSGCVSQAHAELSSLAPGRPLDFIPMLEGDTSGERFLAAMDAARAAGSSSVSIWRRGVVRPEVWEAAWNIWEPASVVASAWPSYWVWSPCPWDGCILKEVSSPNLYVLHSGAKFYIPSPEALAAMGRRAGDYWIVGDGMLETVADVPWDGTLLQEAGSATVYVIYAGAKFAIPNQDALYAMGLAYQPVHIVGPGGLNQIPSVPREGTRIAELGGTSEWQIAAGARFPLPSPEMRDALIGAGALEGTLYVVPPGALAQIPTTPHDGSRVRELSSGSEWQVAAGAKFPLPDAIVRNQLVRKGALEWRLNIVPDGALAALPTAPRDGTRAQELGNDREWQITAGMKFPLTDAGRREALIAAGSLTAQVTIVPPGALGPIAEGPQEGTLLQEVGGGALFVMRCGSLYRIQDNAQLNRLVSAGLARQPILRVSGPLVEPDVTARKRCAASGMDLCPAVGWAAANPFAPPGCKPQEAQPSQ